jgi:hypothetical protein
MGGRTVKRFRGRSGMKGGTYIRNAGNKNDIIRRNGHNALVAPEHAKLAVLAVRGRTLLERRFACRKLEVVGNACDGADRHQLAGKLRPRLCEQRPQRLQEHREGGDPSDKTVPAQEHLDQY